MSRVPMALFTLVTVTLYLALAAWGEGGLAAFLARPALIALAAVTWLAAFAALATAGSMSRGEREDGSNRWVIIAFVVIGIADGYLPAWTDAHGVWEIGGEAVRWTGVALFAIGCALRLAPVFVLGARFSGLVAIQPDHRLETRGLYGLVRNPSYVGLLVTMLGWGLAYRTWAGVILAVLAVPILIGRIHAEERMLASQFGEAWTAYRARTWRLVPWVY